MFCSVCDTQEVLGREVVEFLVADEATWSGQAAQFAGSCAK